MRDVQDEGSLVAVAGDRHAAWLVRLGLEAIQHRGAGGVGLASADGDAIRGLRGAGPVSRVLTDRAVDAHGGTVAVGRLSGVPAVDVGSDLSARIQEPVVRSWGGGQVAVASAGRLTNGAALRQQLLYEGVVFEGSSDAELLAALLARQPGRTLVNRLVAVLHDLHGSFAIALATERLLVVARDPRGYRPLVRGLRDGAVVFASEDAALRDLGCTRIRPVAPGEVVVVQGSQAQSLHPFLPRTRQASLADLVAIAREDSRVDGTSVREVRTALGAQLAAEHPVAGAALVTALPEASTAAAAYAEASARPYRQVLFPGPDSSPGVPAGLDPGAFARPLRATGVRGQEVVLVVPTLVTGRRVREAARALRDAGALRIHLRAAAPPVGHPEPFGLSLPPPEALVAVAHPTPGELCDALAVDSAASLSRLGLQRAVLTWEDGWCDTPWTGHALDAAEVSSNQLGLFEG